MRFDSSYSLIVAVEGPDGSGKTTVVEAIAKWLQSVDVEFIQVREPGGTRIGEKVRSVLQDPDLVISPYTELMLFAAARAQLMSDVILPASNEGKIVLMDRFVASTIAYQGFGRNLLADAQAVVHATVGPIRPAMTLYLDVPVEVAIERRRASGEKLSRIETETIEFFERVREGYEHQIQAAQSEWVRIDATRPIEEVCDLAIRPVSRMIGMYRLHQEMQSEWRRSDAPQSGIEQ